MADDIDPKNVEFAVVVKRVLDHEAAMVRNGERQLIDIKNMARPGSLIWTDPLTQEERITAPGDSMYSTATMFATHVIGEDGKRQPIYTDE